MKKATKLLIVATIIMISVGALVCGAYYYIFTKPILLNNVWVYIDKETTNQDVYAQLEMGGISADDFKLVHFAEQFYAKKEGGAIENNTGAYFLPSGLTAARIVTRLLRHQQTPIKITFNETRLVEDLAGKISSKLMTDSIAMLNAIYSPNFLAECETDSANVIGFFLPDTYEVYWDITPEKFTQRMLTEYKKFWNEGRITKAKDLGLTPKQATIICSIAEEETLNRAERGVVARLYLNRFQIGMPLQADPTVKFAIGDFSLRRILNVHLENNSPYNTYKHAGLPPGPIRIVDKTTINALLDSKPHKYLYMCAKEDFSGTHNFATTLAEHMRNADRYHAALNRMMRSKK